MFLATANPMNIQLLQDYINEFHREVIESGFKRDLDDYITSLPASSNNIVALRDIGDSVRKSLEVIYSGDLPEYLRHLLPGKKSSAFTAHPHLQQLNELLLDTQITQPQLYEKLSSILAVLRDQIHNNSDAIDAIQKFIDPYITGDVARVSQDGVAMISIVFNEKATITSLDKLTKSLLAWDRLLPVYHQLLKSDPPRDIEIVEVQNGSIDVIVNLDVDVALDLVELFKLGFKVFSAYLAYKAMLKPIVDSFYGNKKLIAQEESREQLLLENLGDAVKDKIKEQYQRAKKFDKSIDGTAIPKKIEVVANLITSHIVKGNDIKLLALPPSSDSSGEAVDPKVLIESLREDSAVARRQLRQIPEESQQKLLEVYGEIIDPSGKSEE